MKFLWQEKAWKEYVDWQKVDKKTLKRINVLLEDISRNEHRSKGKPEPLSGNLSGWCVRIDSCNRIVFRISEENIEILQCGTHYRMS